MRLGFVLTLLLFVSVVLPCIARRITDMEGTWVFNIGTDVISIAVCAVVYFGCMMDSNGPSENTALFNTLVLVNAFALFFDALSWIVQGLAPYAFWNRLVNALLYANGSVVIYLFWRYVTSTLGVDSRRLQVVRKVLNALNRSKAKNLRGLLDAVRQDVDHFAGDAEQFDDLTMMCLRYSGKE